MTQKHCDYSGDRDGVLVAYLYGDIDPSLRAAFATHLAGCPACRDELAAFGGVRERLGQWAVVEPELPIVSNVIPDATRPMAAARGWWRDIPAWAQVAAAFVFLGVAAGIANLDARFDRGGLTVRTGWSRDAGSPVRADESGNLAPWREEFAALEARLRADLRASTPAAVAPAGAGGRQASSLDAEALGRVRALISDSERRQQRELALRVAEIVREVNTQRQADLVRIDRTLGQLQTNTGVEVMRQRELLNYFLRTSQRQQ
jgi:anti-sigma factor RsiW